MREGRGWAEVVLDKLLDKYEASAAFVREEWTVRRIQLAMSDAAVPKYKSGGMEPDSRRELHTTLLQWADDGIVELDWARFEKGNLLARVLLCWDGIDRAYQVLGREPKTEELLRLREELEVYRDRLSASWMQVWLKDVTAFVNDKKSVPESLIPADDQKRALLLEALVGIVDKGDETLPMRLFSKRYLKSSKVFEQQVRTRFISLLRQYWVPARFDRDAVGLSLTSEDSALLAEVGIEVTHEDVALCGPVVMRWAGATKTRQADVMLDGSLFPFGLALDTEVLDKMEIVQLPVARVLTIENKANYRHYIRNEQRPDELTIYLGGFPSPGKRRFLRRLWQYAETRSAGTSEQLAFHHWGDLDYGGILIGQTLRESVWPTMQPWRMEPEWLDKLIDFVEPFDAPYRGRLESLLDNNDYGVWHHLIQKLLQVGGTLEQEALLV